MKRSNWLVLIVASWPLSGVSQASDSSPIEIGSNRQLFVDRHVIDKLTNARLVLHQPVRRELAIVNEHPWERFGVSYMVTFRDGGKFRAWYRCDGVALSDRKSLTAYAESTDGIHWTKPQLGIIEFGGSKQNNLVWDGPGVNMAVFKDANPAAPASERYKAIVRTDDVLGLVSPDGLQWRLAREEPILTERPFDSHNIAFWDASRKHYVAYTRGITRKGKVGAAMNKSFGGGVRGIRRTTSKNFRDWSPLQLIDTGDAPIEHLYTNAAIAYDRAPGIYLMFPSRYADARKPNPKWKHDGVNDIVFMSSRDGLRFDRTFMEAFVRPGLDQSNWHERALYMERGILHTSAGEISMYAMENWRLDTVHIRRLTLRTDGFSSVRAPYSGGELLTRPLRFAGKSLRFNFSTSAVGSVRVEIQDAHGEPILGYSMQDCPEIYGDQTDGAVTWKASGDVSNLAGKLVRLRFVLRDADLFAFRFSDR